MTLEEGTWAAWLYDLAQAARHGNWWYVIPAGIALLKEGSKSDRIDARKLAELVARELAAARSITAEHGVRTLRRSWRGSYLAISKDLVTSDVPREGDLPQLGDCLCREAGLCTALIAAEWLGKIQRGGSAPPGRVLLPTARCVAVRCARTCGASCSTEGPEARSAWKLLRADPVRSARSGRRC